MTRRPRVKPIYAPLLAMGMLCCPNCGQVSLPPPHELLAERIEFPCHACKLEWCYTMKDGEVVAMQWTAMVYRDGKRVAMPWADVAGQVDEVTRPPATSGRDGRAPS